MVTHRMSRGEHHEREWSARPLRPIARWLTVIDESGASHLEMSWSVPEPTPAAVVATVARTLPAQALPSRTLPAR